MKVAVAASLAAAGLVLPASPAGAASRWSIVASPNPSGATSSHMYGVSCPTSTSCFAVGSYYSAPTTKTLVERWNGTRWRIVASPNPSGATSSGLNGVSCSSGTSCFAVGYSRSGSTTKTLVERWNGTRWRIVASPNPSGGTSSALSDVSCATATSCFAVGSHGGGSLVKSLVERWNGTRWSIVTSPNASGTISNYLYAVSCSTKTSCLAVGDSSISPPENTALVERWNGTRWSIVASPNAPGTTDNSVFGVSCSSRTSCLAVGGGESADWNDETIVRRWNGTSLSIVASPNPVGADDSGLDGVSCPTSTSCLAVGGYAIGSTDRTLVERWNGTRWSIVASPNASGTTDSYLVDVSCSTSTRCFAVGYYYNTSTYKYKMLIERYS